MNLSFRLGGSQDLGEFIQKRTGCTFVVEVLQEQELSLLLIQALAAGVGGRFGIKAAEAKDILGEVVSVVSQWKKVGKKLRLPAASIEGYASAFEHPLIDEARRLASR